MQFLKGRPMFTHPQSIFRMITAIKIAGDQKNTPTVIDLDQLCPSCKEVQESYSKLKKLCLCSKSQLLKVWKLRM